MRFQDASRQQQRIVRNLLRTIIELIRPFRRNKMTNDEWVSVLALIYPRVEEARRESARLARDYYDSERIRHIGERANTYLAHYEFEWFVEDMEEARAAFTREDATDQDVNKVALHVAKVTENGWRKTMIEAVQNDPLNDEASVIDSDRDTGARIEDSEEDGATVVDDAPGEPEVRERPALEAVPRSGRVRWARVATGRETCAFCLILVSRGPVYQSAKSAGLNTSNENAMRLLQRGDETAINAVMTRWHEGCDCRVVPVFDYNRWAGRAAQQRALELWMKYSKGAKNNRDAINRLRRALYHGEIDLDEFKKIAAA